MWPRLPRRHAQNERAWLTLCLPCNYELEVFHFFLSPLLPACGLPNIHKTVVVF